MAMHKQVILRSGASMPLVGLGTVAATAGEMATAVADALNAGYRHIDCASVYRNEAEVGAAIAASALPRHELFITSKLWNDRRRPSDVRDALEQTLRDLRLQYLDLYLIHWPVVWRRDSLLKPDNHASLKECWQTLELLVDAGKIRHIGVSNYNQSEIEQLLSYARIKPTVNQIELHPRLPQSSLVSYCQSQGIVVTAYCPLGRGGKNGLLVHPVVAAIAARCGVPPASVVLRWIVDRGVAVVPKSSNPTRQSSNIELWSFTLSAAETAELDALSDGARIVRVPWNSFDDCRSPTDYALYAVARVVCAVVFTVLRIDITSFGSRCEAAPVTSASSDAAVAAPAVAAPAASASASSHSAAAA